MESRSEIFTHSINHLSHYPPKLDLSFIVFNEFPENTLYLAASYCFSSRTYYLSCVLYVTRAALFELLARHIENMVLKSFKRFQDALADPGGDKKHANYQLWIPYFL